MALFNANCTEKLKWTKIWPKKGENNRTQNCRIGTCSLELRPQPQSAGVEVDVVAHEGGDEVVGVVVEGLHPQLHIVVFLGGRQEEVLWLQGGSKKPSAVPWSI